MHLKGLKHLIACYSNGLEQIKKIYRQDVLGIEHRNTRGRRALGVIRIKLKDYNEQKKARHKTEKRITHSSTNPIESE